MVTPVRERLRPAPGRCGEVWRVRKASGETTVQGVTRTYPRHITLPSIMTSARYTPAVVGMEICQDASTRSCFFKSDFLGVVWRTARLSAVNSFIDIMPLRRSCGLQVTKTVKPFSVVENSVR